MALKFLNNGYFAGTVGIGTESPLKKLSINGGDVAVNNGNSFIVGAAITGNTQIGELGADSGQLQLLTESTRDIKFGSTTYGNIMFLEGSNGNVGIGETNPDVRLIIKNTSANDGIRIHTSDTSEGFVIFRDDSGTSPGAVVYDHRIDMLGFKVNGVSDRMQILSTGQLVLTAYSSSGTIGTPTYMLGTDGSGNVVKVLGADIPGVPAGSGTLNTVTMWTPDGDTLGNSPITISGNNATFAGEITATNIYAETYRSSRSDGEIYIQAATASDFVSIGTQVANNLMRIQGNGNVGINNTNPHFNLQITGGNATEETVLKLDKGTTSDTGGHTTILGFGTETGAWAKSGIGFERTGSYDIGDMHFLMYPPGSNTGSVSLSDTVMTIKNSGNVGIGTTSPGALLHLVGTTPELRIATAADGQTARLGLYEDAAGTHHGGYIQYVGGGDTLSLGIVNSTVNTDVITIKDNFNVGIGTTNPAHTLDVRGPDTDNAIIARFYSSEGSRGDFIIRNGSSTAPTTYIGTGGGSEELSIGTEDTNAIYIDNQQRVGIGTTSPSAKLDVAGTGNFTGLVSGITPVAAANFVTKAYVDGSGGGTGPFLPLAGGTLTGALAGTSASFTGSVTAGSGGGSVALTFNDGGGNANVTFNHANETPDVNGNSFRISTNVDASSSPVMLFEMKANVTAGTAVTTLERFRIDNTGVKVRNTSGGVIDLQRDDTSVVGANVLGKLRFMADDPTNNSFNIGAEIKAKAEAAWDTDSYPSGLEFYTTTTDTSILALTIDKDQDATFVGDVTAPTFIGNVTGNLTGIVTATSSLADGVTGATQADSDDSELIATTAFVQNLIETIPAGLRFEGTWDARTVAQGGTGNPPSASPANGQFWIVSVDGSTNLSGITDWKVGDWAIYVVAGAGTDGWQKVDNSSVLDGSGTGGTMTAWAGSGTSNTLTDSPVTFTSAKVEIPRNVEILTSGYPYIDLGVSSSNYFRIIYDNPNDILKIGKNGAATASSVIINPSGNVGIGVSPTAKLHIQGTSSANGAIKIQNSGGNPYAIYSDDNDLLFTNGNGSTTALTIAYSGNATFAGDITLGANHIGRDDDNYIGFETDNLIKFRAAGATQVKIGDGIFSPQTDSDVDLGSSGTRFKELWVDSINGGSVVPGSYLPLSAGSGFPLTGDLYLGAFNKISGVTNDNLVIGVDINNLSGASSFDIQMDGSTSAFYINNSRQVGIGTTSIANAKLKVSGGGVDIESATDSLRLRFYEGATFKSGIQQVLSIGEMITASAVGDMAIRANAGNMLFATGGSTERMRIDSAGNVGIGDTDPQQKLHIVDTDGANIILNSNTGAENNGIWMTEGGVATPYVNGSYVHYDSTNNEFKINTGAASLATRFTIARDTGAIKFNSYNSTNQTGTPTYLLGTDASGNVVKTLTTPSPVTSQAASLYDLIPNGAFTTTYAFTSTAGTYAKVMQGDDVITANGTYTVQMFVDDYAVGGTQYSETYSGIMSWGSSTNTNDTGGGTISEIVLHRSGHAANQGMTYLRTRETTSSEGSELRLEIMCNKTYTGASNVVFKFVRLI